MPWSCQKRRTLMMMIIMMIFTLSYRERQLQAIQSHMKMSTFINSYFYIYLRLLIHHNYSDKRRILQHDIVAYKQTKVLSVTKHQQAVSPRIPQHIAVIPMNYNIIVIITITDRQVYHMNIVKLEHNRIFEKLVLTITMLLVAVPVQHSRNKITVV